MCGRGVEVRRKREEEQGRCPPTPAANMATSTWAGHEVFLQHSWPPGGWRVARWQVEGVSTGSQAALRGEVAQGHTPPPVASLATSRTLQPGQEVLLHSPSLQGEAGEEEQDLGPVTTLTPGST